jgi:cysteine desulfurase
MKSVKNKRIYLDYAATTPLDPMVLRAMQPYLGGRFGNPSSLHSFGQEARGAVDKARETIAAALEAKFDQIIFTGSATEANNFALRGVVTKSKVTIPHPRIIISSIEHESVLETARALKREGVEIVYLPVDVNGVIDQAALRDAVNERTVLVSVMMVNNEIGTLEPIQKIAQVIATYKEGRKARAYPLFHTDAVQAFAHFSCLPSVLGVDLMTISGHKLYGPKGVGGLYIKERTLVAPVVTGGGQEYELRSGTENVAGIVGFAEAVRLAMERRKGDAHHLALLKTVFFKGIKKALKDVVVNGSLDANVAAPHILNVYFPQALAEDLLIAFDLRGLAVSAGSACSTRSVTPSYVIRALGHTAERAQRSIRFSFGRATTKRELEAALYAIKETSKRFSRYTSYTSEKRSKK